MPILLPIGQELGFDYGTFWRVCGHRTVSWIYYLSWHKSFAASAVSEQPFLDIVKNSAFLALLVTVLIVTFQMLFSGLLNKIVLWNFWETSPIMTEKVFNACQHDCLIIAQWLAPLSMTGWYLFVVVKSMPSRGVFYAER